MSTGVRLVFADPNSEIGSDGSDDYRVDVIGVTSTSANITVTSLTYALGTTTNAMEECAAGDSGLQNLGVGYHQFNWKTQVCQFLL